MLQHSGRPLARRLRPRRRRAPASAPAASGSQAAGGKQWKIGYSNGGGVGNGFREEQVCTAKAEALASGQVSQLTTIHRNTDAAGQLQDIRDLIAADVDAIVFNPNDPAALNPALEEAKAAGIMTVAVDQFVTNPDTYQLFNNQVKYAELGAKWLFDQLRATGTVWYQRGFAGAGADTDRDTGFQNVLKDYPGITVLPNKQGVATQWDPAITTQVTNDFIASGDYDKVNGIWTSGMDVETIDAIKAAGKKFVPLVGTDRGGSVTKFLDPANYPGLDGAAVTNTAAVGGAGVALALKLLNGETVTDRSDRGAAEHRAPRSGPGRQPDRRGQGRRCSRGSSTASIPAGRSASRSRATPTTRRSRPSPARAPTTEVAPRSKNGRGCRSSGIPSRHPSPHLTPGRT